jgi:hypothetical protein
MKTDDFETVKLSTRYSLLVAGSIPAVTPRYRTNKIRNSLWSTKKKIINKEINFNLDFLYYQGSCHIFFWRKNKTAVSPINPLTHRGEPVGPPLFERPETQKVMKLKKFEK